MPVCTAGRRGVADPIMRPRECRKQHPKSHIPQDKLTEAAARIPRCTLLTIPAGHDIDPQEGSRIRRWSLGLAHR